MREYLIVNKCNFCANKNFKIIIKLKEQNLVKCSNCGLNFLDKQRIDKNLYENNYYKKGEVDGISNYCNYAFREKLAKEKFKFAYNYILKSKLKNKKLLEIGSGFGYFLKYIPKDIKKYAIEISSLGAEKTSNNNRDAIVYNSDFIKQNLKESFDYIISFDVIEHQINLSLYLKKINSSLKKDGVFIFTTPDYGTILNKLLGKRAPTVQPLYHNFYFTKDWFIKNLPNYNLEVVSIKTVYFEHIDLGSALLYLTFIVPFISKTPILQVIRKLRLDSSIVPFWRLGGIECIAKKID